MQAILDGLVPMPATVANDRCDILAWNAAYAAILPHVATAGPCERNSMWMAFTLPPCCNPAVNFEETAPGLVAVFRHRAVGEIRTRTTSMDITASPGGPARRLHPDRRREPRPDRLAARQPRGRRPRPPPLSSGR
ncbi:hypothetical protein [Actinomadura sp. B10D3]|uniref:MmyB family transcriptional regulator n=1 Tax=Actinomadura sp. B10D3 TaxID=3153557 RepID=UPI00325CE0E4